MRLVKIKEGQQFHFLPLMLLMFMLTNFSPPIKEMKKCEQVIYILTTFKFKFEAIMADIGKQENGKRSEI